MARECNNIAWIIVFVLLTGATLQSCIDNTYSLKDVDLTVGLGSDKLSLKLGSTEKIFLRTMLKVEDSDIIDTLSTGSSLYYLVRKGSAGQSIKVDNIPPFSIENVDVQPEVPLVNPPSTDVSIPKGRREPQVRTGENDIEVNIDDIPKEVARLFRIFPKTKSLKISLAVEQPAYAKFEIADVKNLSITFPDFFQSNLFEKGTHTLKIADIIDHTGNMLTFPDIPVEYVQFGTSNSFGEAIANGMLSAKQEVSMSGSFTLNATEAFVLRKDDKVNIKLIVETGNIEVQSIEGIVDPEINPTVDPIKIADDVPDFLQDPEVSLEMNNPTIKITITGDERPIPLLFRASLYAETDGKTVGDTVSLPTEGSDEIAMGSNQTLYYYQGKAPFDPNGFVPETSILRPVDNIGALIRKLPDYVRIDLSHGNIHSDNSRMHSIEPGRNFEVQMDYEVLVPFSFDKGLEIVYNDTIGNLHKDLENYQAEGLTVTATAVSTVPLDLGLTLTPVGVGGEDLTGKIEKISAVISAAGGAEGVEQSTPLTLTIKINDPKAVSRLEQFNVRVEGKSAGSSELRSSQYLFLKDIRLKLNGQIITNLN
ncbi:MAG: hypothetical protein LBM62_05255 [Mediterranea sp.]|jgi:hypothetical protein|nr:hypothetical protein [Mediterranea sp.]